jgi:hypothetical protein
VNRQNDRLCNFCNSCSGIFFRFSGIQTINLWRFIVAAIMGSNPNAKIEKPARSIPTGLLDRVLD